jgi:glycosyltransferase involved in cell wall biosynthesis
MISELERIKPDIVHLHNIHGHDCNLDMLFTYFRKNKTKLVWTFHDCWAFTGYCTYFDMANCNKWQTQCEKCPKRREQSWFFDKSSKLFEKKKRLFEGLDLTIVTPSQWLADLVKQSFLKDYPVKVINNGIELSVFKPMQSDFRDKYGISQNKKIILGVAFDWGARKGLDVFLELSRRLDAEKYQIVLVGTNDKIDERLVDNIISIHRTQNQTELAEIYSAADVFVNPTREENYPTVNMEALACGTPVLTFRTGGSPEMLDETCGSVVAYGDVEALEKELIRICSKRPYSTEQCIQKAKEFDQNDRFKEYLDLYEGIVDTGNQAN